MPSKLIENAIAQKSLSGTPEEITARLNSEVLKVLREVRELLNSLVGEFNSGAVTLGTSGLMLRWGVGDPNLSFAADPVGSLFLRTDGGAGTTFYVREPVAWAGK